MNTLPERAQALFDFWFGSPDHSERLHHKQIWFRSTPDFDAAVRENFAADHDLAVAGALVDWEVTPESALALVMLLDQVPRNIFRSTPRAFASDKQALATTNRAVARGFDMKVPACWRLFFYLPYEHSEVLADQQRGIDLLEALPPVPGRATDMKMSRKHLEIIERFGRFPHRNPIIGRPSTPEEIAFLEESDLRFGQPYVEPIDNADVSLGLPDVPPGPSSPDLTRRSPAFIADGRVKPGHDERTGGAPPQANSP